jgi:hypothetical protein
MLFLPGDSKLQLHVTVSKCTVYYKIFLFTYLLQFCLSDSWEENIKEIMHKGWLIFINLITIYCHTVNNQKRLMSNPLFVESKFNDMYKQLSVMSLTMH